MRIFNHQVIQIVQSLCQQQGHDVGLEDRRIVRPAQYLDHVGAERATQRQGIASRNHEFGKVNDYGDPFGA